MLIKNPLYYLPLERVQSFRKDGINISILQALKGSVNKKTLNEEGFFGKNDII